MKQFLNLIAAASLLGLGCDKPARPASNTPPPPAPSASTSAPPPAAVRPPESGGPSKAQPKLPTVKLWIGKEEMTAEVASTFPQVQTGMMFRTNMLENEGMIFIFQRPSQTAFWMKNTLLPLSCAYIDTDGIILEQHDMKPLDESPIPASTDQVRFVLETKQGWFERHNIPVGTAIRAEQGSLSQTFFGR